MTDLPPDGIALFATILASPSDPLPKSVLADWLDEHDEPVIAHGFRWCAAYGRHPNCETRRSWSWGESFAADQRPDCLPDLVARIVVATPRNFTTPWEAFAVLADALEELATLVLLPRD